MKHCYPSPRTIRSLLHFEVTRSVSKSCDVVVLEISQTAYCASGGELIAERSVILAGLHDLLYNCVSCPAQPGSAMRIRARNSIVEGHVVEIVMVRVTLVIILYRVDQISACTLRLVTLA